MVDEKWGTLNTAMHCRATENNIMHQHCIFTSPNTFKEFKLIATKSTTLGSSSESKC